MLKNTELLSSHFEGNDLENLLKIIDMMQNPDSFEFGISQLETLNLYDNFISFLKLIMSPYMDLNGVDDKMLLVYMFSKTIMVRTRDSGHIVSYQLLMEFEDRVLSIKTISNTIFLPLFPQTLTVDIFDVHHAEFKYNKTFLPPIHIKSSHSTFKEFPVTTYSVDVNVPVSSVPIDIRETFNAIPNHVSSICWRGNNICTHNFWGEGFKRFHQLKKLSLDGNRLVGELRLDLPPTVEELSIYFFSPDNNFLDVYELVARCLEESPLLDTLELTSAFFDDDQIELMDTLMAKYHFIYNPAKELYTKTL